MPKFQVSDPSWCYPIGQVQVLAGSERDAREAAFQAMTGAECDEVAGSDEILASFVVVELSPPALRDKDQQFAAVTMTREGIAEDLNHSLSGDEESTEFRADDARLTDDFCTEYARAYGEVLVTSDDTLDDCWVELARLHAAKLGVTVVSEDC